MLTVLRNSEASLSLVMIFNFALNKKAWNKQQSEPFLLIVTFRKKTMKSVHFKMINTVDFLLRAFYLNKKIYNIVNLLKLKTKFI